MYVSYFIAKQGTIFIDVCYRQVAQFCFACSPSGLYGPVMWLFRKQKPCASFRAIFPAGNFPRAISLEGIMYKAVSPGESGQ